MKITVAGQDRSDVLVREITAAAADLSDAELERLLAGESDLLLLNEAERTDDYLDQLITLARHRNSVDPSEMKISAGKGIVAGLGRVLRRCLWKMIRPFHDWIAFRQNSVNIMLTYALEFEKQERQAAIRKLEEKIRRLEDGRKAEGGSR